MFALRVATLNFELSEIVNVSREFTGPGIGFEPIVLELLSKSMYQTGRGRWSTTFSSSNGAAMVLLYEIITQNRSTRQMQ
jgi:hypothetical protein